MSFFKKSIHTTVFRMIGVIVGIFISAIIARELGPHNKGVLSAIILIPSFIILLGGFGIEISNIYFIPQNKERGNKYYSNSIVIALILSAIFIPIGGIIFYLFRNKWFSEVPVNYLLWSLLIIPVGLIVKYIRGVILGFNKIEISNKIELFVEIINLIFLIIISVVYKLTISWIIFITILLNIINFIFELYYLKYDIKIRIKIKPDFKETKTFFSYGIKGHFANVLSFLNYRLDMFLVMYFLNATSLGIYTIAVAIAEKMWFLPDILSSVLFPHISTYKDKNITPFLCRVIFAIMILSSIAMILIGRYLIFIVYGKSYLASFFPLLFLLPGIVFLSIAKIISSDITGRGHSEVPLISSAVSAGTNFLLNIILIPKYGINGAAGASAFSYTIHTFYLIFRYLKITGYKLRDVLVLKRSDIKYVLSYRKNYI